MLNFSFTNIKLKNFISPLLKPKVSKELKSGIIYQFKCPCSDSYIGETKQLLCYRVQQHRRDHDSNIYSHINLLKYLLTYKIVILIKTFSQNNIQTLLFQKNDLFYFRSLQF